jgi:hypothetical protein
VHQEEFFYSVFLILERFCRELKTIVMIRFFFIVETSYSFLVDNSNLSIPAFQGSSKQHPF